MSSSGERKEERKKVVVPRKAALDALNEQQATNEEDIKSHSISRAAHSARDENATRQNDPSHANDAEPSPHRHEQTDRKGQHSGGKGRWNTEFCRCQDVLRVSTEGAFR